MTAPAYFSDAADYHDWWFFSGTALGAASPGETFKMLKAQLSEAGANTVIAARFLEENDRGIDLELWRGAFVVGHAGLQVALTLRALESIGAVGVVTALRSSPDKPSLMSRAQEFLRSGNHDPGETLRIIHQLHGNVAVGTSHAQGDSPEQHPGAILPPRPTEGVETCEGVRCLLDAYVAAHHEDLARDVARHGDPRRHPDFDPQRAREDRARRIKRLNHQRYQSNAIVGLREQLDKLKALAASAPPESPRINKALRKILNDYDDFAKHPPEDLTPEVESWLREVERFRDALPDALAPSASTDERVNGRLAAIGPFEVSFDRETPTISWAKPAGIASDWTAFRLIFSVVLDKKPDPLRVNAALDALCDEWGRLRARWPNLHPQLEHYVIGLFRNLSSSNLTADERAAFEDEDGELSDEKILGAVQGGSIVLTRYFEEPVHTEIDFGVSWDDEHGVEVQFDENGKILPAF